MHFRFRRTVNQNLLTDTSPHPEVFSELGLVSDSSGFTDYNDTFVNPKTKPEVGFQIGFRFRRTQNQNLGANLT